MIQLETGIWDKINITILKGNHVNWTIHTAGGGRR